LTFIKFEDAQIVSEEGHLLQGGGRRGSINLSCGEAFLGIFGQNTSNHSVLEVDTKGFIEPIEEESQRTSEPPLLNLDSNLTTSLPSFTALESVSSPLAMWSKGKAICC
jgi:hypothetical protein